MNLFQILILSVVQGITEFLPISSSGHLVIFQKIFGLSQPPVYFDILLHLGTLVSIVFFFRNELFVLLKDLQKNIKIWNAIIIGSVPAIIVGFLLKAGIDNIFNSLSLVGILMIIGSFILFSTKAAAKLKTSKKENLKEISVWDAFFVGIFQAIAILPGISRSGSSITGGLWKNLSKETAFKFSFFLSIPAILGAVILKVKDIQFINVSFFESLLAMLVSAVVGYFSLKYLEKTLKSEKFYRDRKSVV